MQLLVGLGNPSQEYQFTRHNVGALFAYFMSQKLNGSPWQLQKKFSSLLSEAHVQKEKWLLIFPQTYMNLSGTAVQATQSFYKIDLSSIYVAYDDLDIEFGQFKLTTKGPRGHNGVNDISTKLGSDSFHHLRFGIDNRGGDRRLPSSDYVLTPFTSAEKTRLPEIFTSALHTLINHV